MISDTERLDFLLRHFHVEDVGDEQVAYGMVFDCENLEEALGGAASSDEDLRTIIDRAIAQQREDAIKDGLVQGIRIDELEKEREYLKRKITEMQEFGL